MITLIIDETGSSTSSYLRNIFCYKNLLSSYSSLFFWMSVSDGFLNILQQKMVQMFLKNDFKGKYFSLVLYVKYYYIYIGNV